MQRLSDNFTRGILAGHYPVLGWARAQDCPVVAGEIVVLREHPIVSVTFTALQRTKKGGIRAVYRVRDHRPQFLAPASGTTSDRYRSIDPDVEAERLDDRLYGRLHGEAGAEAAWRREQQRMRDEKVRQERRLQNARLSGKRHIARAIQRHIGRIDDRLELAA